MRWPALAHEGRCSAWGDLSGVAELRPGRIRRGCTSHAPFIKGGKKHKHSFLFSLSEKDNFSVEML